MAGSRLAICLSALVLPVGAAAQIELVGDGLEISQTAGFIHEPSVAFDPDGGFAVVWNRLAGCGGGSCTGSVVVGRRFDPQGEALGDEFEIATDAAVTNDAPLVAISPQGVTAVMWTAARTGTGNRRTLEMRIFDREGWRLQAEVTIRPRVPDEHLLEADLASLSNGDFVAVWYSSWFFDLVEGQRFSGAGKRRGKRLIINTQGGGFASPAIAAGGANGALVAWLRGAVVLAGERSVQARRLTSTGKPRGEDFTVNADPRDLTLFYSHPDVTLNDDGEAAVVWSLARQTTNLGIRLRRLDRQGKPIGREIQVGEFPGWVADKPVVVPATQGRRVVVWQRFDSLEDETVHDIFARQIDTEGRPSGPELNVNTSFAIAGEQHSPAAAASPDGRILSVWVDELGGRRRVRGQFLALGAGASLSVSRSLHRSGPPFGRSATVGGGS